MCFVCSLPGVGGVDARDPGVRELSRLSIFDDDVPALLYAHSFGIFSVNYNVRIHAVTSSLCYLYAAA